MDNGNTDIILQVTNTTNQTQNIILFDSFGNPNNPIVPQNKYQFTIASLAGLTSGYAFSITQNNIATTIVSTNIQTTTTTGASICNLINSSGLFPSLVFSYDATSIFVYSGDIVFNAITRYSYSELTNSTTSATQNLIGAVIYDVGFTPNTGVGVPTALPNIPLWVNVGANTTDGGFNRCGSGIAVPFPTTLRFASIFNVNAPTSRTYYLGVNANISGSEEPFYVVYVNGVLALRTNGILMNANILAYTGIDGALEPLRNLFLVYPIQLNAGYNQVIINDIISGSGSAQIQGIEIYNNTKAQIQAATTLSNLNIIFTTANSYTLYDIA
jgi:hypothetical protein